MKSEIRQNVQREQVAQGQAEHPETEQDAAAQKQHKCEASTCACR